MEEVLYKFENEFFSELKSAIVRGEELLSLEISKSIINIEKQLENIFGVDIIVKSFGEYDETVQKKVEAVKLSDIAQNDVLKKLYDEIELDENATWTQTILSKVEEK